MNGLYFFINRVLLTAAGFDVFFPADTNIRAQHKIHFNILKVRTTEFIQAFQYCFQ